MDDYTLDEPRCICPTGFYYGKNQIAVKLQWLEHLWNHEKMFETGVVRANKC